MNGLLRMRWGRGALWSKLSNYRSASTFAEGQKLCKDKWVVSRVQSVPEFELEATELRHVHCGAKYLHMASSDEINSFSINFKTIPMESNGISHILEHVTLCGSRKFPVRDPFFKMLNRSLATFMNAMTGSDYTLYPFSTPNPKDFYNLMSVYLDAVFNPNLSEQDFRQEGWRLEHENSNLIIKGVVFNEMKGVYADPQQVFGRHLMNKILPSHTYGVCSGGLPEKIPDLTWKKLKDFHKTHYNPNNARFLSHGNMNLEDHLQAIDPFLPKSGSDFIPVPDVPSEPTWNNPRQEEIQCAPNPAAPLNTETLAIAFKLCDINDVYETLVLQILSGLLVDSANSPFYKSLLEPGLGSNFAPSTGFDPHVKDTLFVVGLQGARVEDRDKVLGVIKDTFEKAAKDGFEQDRINAILNRTELSIKNKKNNFGVNLIMAMTPSWNHSEEAPLKHLMINDHIKRFREDLKKNPDFLQQKIRKYFIENPHQLTLVMTPSEDYNANQDKLLDTVRNHHAQALKEIDIEELRIKNDDLAKSQNMIEDINCLPTLKIKDIQDQVPRYEVEKLYIAQVPAQLSLQPTNGITFFRALMNTKHLDPELREILPLFTIVMTEMGAGQFDFRKLDTEIDLRTGGLASAYHISENPKDLQSIQESLYISSYCLNDQVTNMFDLWTEIFNDIKLEDLDRLKTLIKLNATEMMNGLPHQGHSYAMNLSSAPLQYGTALRESKAGITQVLQMCSLSQEENLEPLLEKLRKLSKALLNKNHMKIAINTSNDFGTKVVNSTEKFVNSIPGEFRSFEAVTPGSFKPENPKVYIATPFPVHYCSTSVPTVPYDHPDFAALRVMTRLVSLKFLHKEIREKGGAYGGGLASDPSGVLSFYSYRDPNFEMTLDAFDKSLDWIRRKEFNQQDIDEAKLGVFQRVDGPVLPGDRGIRDFLSGVSDEVFEKHRKALKSVTMEDIIKVSEAYLGSNNTKSSAVIGPETTQVDETWDRRSIF